MDTSTLDAIKRQAKNPSTHLLLCIRIGGVEYNASTTAFQHIEAHKLLLMRAPHASARVAIRMSSTDLKYTKAKAVFYSMGNFVFDSTFGNAAVLTGLALASRSLSRTYFIRSSRFAIADSQPMANFQWRREHHAAAAGITQRQFCAQQVVL